MNRLIQVGLLFVSLMVGIQGQEPSISPSPSPSAKPLSCRINLDLKLFRSGRDNVWDGWFFVSISPELGFTCADLKKNVCAYVSRKSRYGCGDTWDRRGACTGPETQGRYRGGVICARGEQCLASSPGSKQHHVEAGMRLISEYLELLATYARWEGDAREWDEIPCYRIPYWKLSSGDLNAIYCVASLIVVVITGIILYKYGCFSRCHKLMGCCRRACQVRKYCTRMWCPNRFPNSVAPSIDTDGDDGEGEGEGKSKSEGESDDEGDWEVSLQKV